jgi:hypothetical protein
MWRTADEPTTMRTGRFAIAAIVIIAGGLMAASQSKARGRGATAAVAIPSSACDSRVYYTPPPRRWSRHSDEELDRRRERTIHDITWSRFGHWETICTLIEKLPASAFTHRDARGEVLRSLTIDVAPNLIRSDILSFSSAIAALRAIRHQFRPDRTTELVGLLDNFIECLRKQSDL